jgi:hypothetical protein
MIRTRSLSNRPAFSSLGQRLAAAESQHAQAVAASLWFWFRLILCALAVPVCALWLYACAYC